MWLVKFKDSDDQLFPIFTPFAPFYVFLHKYYESLICRENEFLRRASVGLNFTTPYKILSAPPQKKMYYRKWTPISSV